METSFENRQGTPAGECCGPLVGSNRQLCLRNPRGRRIFCRRPRPFPLRLVVGWVVPSFSSSPPSPRSLLPRPTLALELLLLDLMEVVENAFVEGTILWLAQTIKERLLTSELADRTREFELAESIEKLQSETKSVEAVVAALKGRATGNKPLVRVFSRLKELMYDADDAVHELNHLKLQRQADGGMDRRSFFSQKK